jgi:predicted MFS family arabinose efflux permease
VLTKESALIWSNLSLILFVMGVGLVIGFFWSKYVANKTKAVVSNNHSPL